MTEVSEIKVRSRPGLISPEGLTSSIGPAEREGTRAREQAVPGIRVRQRNEVSTTEATKSPSFGRRKNAARKERLGSSGQLDRGAVGEHFRHPLSDLRSGEADVDDGVSSHRLGLSDHAVGGLTTGFLKHFGVTSDLAPDERLEDGHDVAADVFGPHGVATDDTEVGRDAVAGNRFSRSGNHGDWRQSLLLGVVNVNFHLSINMPGIQKEVDKIRLAF